MAIAETVPSYVFEVYDATAVSFRRADMDDPQSQEALLIVLSLCFQHEIRREHLDYLLDIAPSEWCYLVVHLREDGGETHVEIAQAEREPGVDSGDHAVITHVELQQRH